MNIARNSKFNIDVNFCKSKGSYLFDNRTQKKYLDFFGMYASLPLGYNHDIFRSEAFINEILSASSFKINNCEFTSRETVSFDRKFSKFSNDNYYTNFHYTCTGALAVESAIKTCIHKSNYKKPNVLSFKNSFHGINSFGSFVTDHFWPANTKLEGLPQNFSTKINCDLEEVERHLKNTFVTCVLVEPIQCSAGDIHHQKQFFLGLRTLCNKYNVPLVFDEIQVGFGGTGKLWFYQHLDIFPDIVIFGKKTQLSGIMVSDNYNDIFAKDQITRLEVTWDGDVMDMIRCKYIMKAYEEYNILQNVENQEKKLTHILKKYEQLKNPRACGLIAAFDMDSPERRNAFVQALYLNGMIVNKTGEKSIRLRPPLSLSDENIYSADKIIKKSLQNIQ